MNKFHCFAFLYFCYPLLISAFPNVLWVLYDNPNAELAANIFDRALEYVVQSVSGEEVEIHVHIQNYPPNKTVASYTTDMCDLMVNPGFEPYFAVSLLTAPNAVLALQNVANTSHVPVIQLDSKAWKYNGVQTPSNTGSYTSFVTPQMEIMSMLKDFLSATHIIGNSSQLKILYDDSFDFSVNHQLQIALTSLGITSKPVQMFEDTTTIDKQLTNISNSAARNVLMLSSVKHAELYMKELATIDTTMTVHIVTKDLYPVQCMACDYANATWTRPSLSATNYSIIQDFKTWLDNYHTHGNEEPVKFSSENEIDASMYLDISNIVWQAVLAYNESKGDATYSCTAGGAAAGDPSLPAFIQDSASVGSYGAYDPVAAATFHQNIQMRTAQVQVNENGRFVVQVANWTASNGYTNDISTANDLNERNHFRIAILNRPPFIETFTHADGSTDVRGYLIDMIEELAITLDFTYDYYFVNDGQYGTIGTDLLWNGLVRDLVDGDADIALAPLTIMGDKENYIDFTLSFYDLVGSTFVMKVQENTYELFEFMTVITWEVWGCMIACYILVSVLLFVLERLSPYSYHNNQETITLTTDPERLDFKFGDCFWFILSVCTATGQVGSPKNYSGRTLLAAWWLFVFVIISSYTANLAAYLTVSNVAVPYTSLDALGSQYETAYGSVKNSPTYMYFKRMMTIEKRMYDCWRTINYDASLTPQERALEAVWDYTMPDKYTKMWQFMENNGTMQTTEEAVDRVLNGDNKYAFIGDATEIRYAILTNCKLKQIGDEFNKRPYALGVQQGSPLKLKLSAAILDMMNNQTFDEYKTKWWTNNPNKVTCPDYSSVATSVSTEAIAGVFVVAAIAFVLTIGIIIFEYFYYKNKQNKPQEVKDKYTPQDAHYAESTPPNGMSGIVSQKTKTLLKHFFT